MIGKQWLGCLMASAYSGKSGRLPGPGLFGATVDISSSVAAAAELTKGDRDHDRPLPGENSAEKTRLACIASLWRQGVSVSRMLGMAERTMSMESALSPPIIEGLEHFTVVKTTNIPRAEAGTPYKAGKSTLNDSSRIASI